VSTNSIARAASDPDLKARVIAAASQLCQTDPMFAQTEFGVKLLNGYTSVDGLIWQVAVEVEAQYEYAILQGRGAPGHDVDVITDDALITAVKTHWPPDTVVAPPQMPPPASDPQPAHVQQPPA
jgi:hypothetical protein